MTSWAGIGRCFSWESDLPRVRTQLVLTSHCWVLCCSVDPVMTGVTVLISQCGSPATKRSCSRWRMGTAGRSRWRSSRASSGRLWTARADTVQPLVVGGIYTSRTSATQTPGPTQISATVTSSQPATRRALHRPSPSWRGPFTSNVMSTRCLCCSSLVRPARSFPTKCTFCRQAIPDR